ncbi:glycosyltransferase family 25 protein [Colwellia sp. BRX9-1]|uniref:glycosyltransferase family 25 protein n=1 Tax=Colwellia sp. BRX9-1 TaxID=2759830 RepID=UPI0015F37ABF|nr:glycosyltransferase family 25 protein [Colwellia sp. BRX9-1]MBA6352880.1 glycosyltransferase family 25 protein [Colwellia sp. BRX9-1]
MKIFVVNLDQRKDRLDFMVTQFIKLGLEYERISATNGKQVFNESKLFNRYRFFLENRQYLVPGELGCAQSHINIWHRIIEEDIDYAVVLEDDVFIRPELKQVFEDINLISNFDYLKIDDCHLHQYEMISGNETLNHDITNYKGSLYKKHIGKLFSAYECDPVPYGTGGYIISKQGAKQFIKASKRMYYAVDLLPRYAAGKIRQGFLSHAIVIPMDVSDSDIGDRSKGIKLKFFERLIWVFHKTFNKRRLRQFDLTIMYKSRKEDK